MRDAIQILVVSSELQNRRALVDILNREDWHTICASTVEECKAALAGRNVILVFCDPRLLDGTYRDVLKIIRSLNKDVPLVVTSRLADWEEYFEVLGHGAFDLIPSPPRATDAIWVTRRAQQNTPTQVGQNTESLKDRAYAACANNPR